MHTLLEIKVLQSQIGFLVLSSQENPFWYLVEHLKKVQMGAFKQVVLPRSQHKSETLAKIQPRLFL